MARGSTAVTTDLLFLAVNICAGRGYAVRQVLETLLEVNGFGDARVTFDRSRPSRALVRLNNGPARTLLGFEEKTSLDEGLRRTLA